MSEAIEVVGLPALSPVAVWISISAVLTLPNMRKLINEPVPRLESKMIVLDVEGALVGKERRENPLKTEAVAGLVTSNLLRGRLLLPFQCHLTSFVK